MAHRIRPPHAKRLFGFVARSHKDVDDDVQEEFAFHLDMRVDDLMRDGMAEPDARAQARREFGDLARGAQACAREGRTVERHRTVARLASELRQDAKFAMRLLRRSPGFSTVAILTLALAIGGNTAIFSLVNALVLKPLPVRSPQEVVRIYTGESQTSWLNYQDIAQRTDVFTDVAAHAGTALALTTDASAVRLTGETTSTNYLTMLGVPALSGRTYFPVDTRTDVVVLGERAWRIHFGSDPSLVGRAITLGGRRLEVLGIMPRGFRGARAAGFMSEFWIPVDASLSRRKLQDRSSPSYTIVARLKAGVSHAQAQAASQVVAQRMAAEHPELGPAFGMTEVFPIDGIGGFRGVGKTLLPFFAFVGLMTIVAGLVLLVGCANIAGLLLGRGAARRREVGVRLALGAARGRLIRQLLTESLLLAIVGGTAGDRSRALARRCRQRAHRAPARIDRARSHARSTDAGLHAHALARHVRAVRPGAGAPRDPHECDSCAQRRRPAALSSADAIVAGGGSGRACLARCCSGAASSSGACRTPTGSTSDSSRRTFSSPIFSSTRRPRRRELSRRCSPSFNRAFRACPACSSRALAKIVPLALMGREETRMRRNTDSPDQPGRMVLVNRVSPDWFRTVRIPLLAGRDFTVDDRPGSPGVVIVNETLARQFWNGDALGKRLDNRDVVGVVRR